MNVVNDPSSRFTTKSELFFWKSIHKLTMYKFIWIRKIIDQVEQDLEAIKHRKI